jgi:hypothetical protein
MEYKENYWLTNSRMVKYQSMLCKNPHVQLEVVKTLHPTTPLQVSAGPLEHDCLEIMDEVFSSWPDLTNQPISHLDIEYFTDGNSFVQKDTFCQICSSDCHMLSLKIQTLPVRTQEKKL